MRRSTAVLFAVALVTAAALRTNAQVITNVERRNPNAASAAAWVRLASGPLGENALCYADRTHLYRNVPPALVGAQYVIMAMEDKDNPNLELHLTIGRPGTLYLILDNRVGTGVRSASVTPDPTAAGMAWVAALGFADTGMDMALDESANGTIDDYYSVFSMAVMPGAVVLRAQNDRRNARDRNMYGVAAVAGVGKATQPAPADGQQMVTEPRLAWTPGVLAAAHDVYLGTTPQLGPADLVGSRLPTTVLLLPGALTPGVTYYWRVDEIGADMVTVATGPVWSFTAAAVLAFDPVPADATSWVDPNVTLCWRAGQGAVGHEVYLGTDPAAVESGLPSVFQAMVSGTTWTPALLAPNTTCFWRVDEVAADGVRRTGPIWSFTTLPAIESTDPDLLVWWRMDEGVGTRIVDWSGHGRHATLHDPAPTWTQGILGGALRFAGHGDDAVYDNGALLNGLDALTIALWIKSDVIGTDKGFLIFEPPDGNDFVGIRYDADGITAGGRNVIKMGITVSEYGIDKVLQLESSSDAQTTDWQHVALVWSSGRSLMLYLNGQLDFPSAGSGPALGTLHAFGAATIGKGGKDVVNSSWQGLLDDLRLYCRALTAQEIQTALQLDPALLAHDPNPPDGGSVNGFDFLSLTWQAGVLALTHDVYVGPDQDAVAAATPADTTGVYRGRLTDTSYTPVPPLPWGPRYFWRIDEINQDGSLSRGPVWGFVLGD